MRASFRIALAAGSILAACSLSGAQTYSILDLTVDTGSPGVVPSGISNNGRITGLVEDLVTGEFHAFIRDADGTFHDLGMLGYDYGVQGVAINNAGQVAGIGYGAWYQAMVYANSQVRSLGNLDDPNSSYPVAINNLGHVVGMARNGDGGFQGFRYMGSGSMIGLGMRVADINDSDKIAGSYDFTWPGPENYVYIASHAVVWAGGVMTDLGDLGGGPHTDSAAYGVNAAGQVTGYATLATGAVHAFRYTSGHMDDLGTIVPYRTRGLSIDASGQVIAGSIETYGGGAVGVFVYSHGVMHDLIDLLGADGASWSELTMTHMNDSGWIVGYGTIDGESHAFLARPVQTCAADFNGDGTLSVQDLFDFLGAWFAKLPNADFNGSGAVTTQDLFDFLTAWFARC